MLQQATAYVLDDPPSYPKCGCEITQICSRIQSNGVRVCVRQCMRCGRNRGAIAKSSPEVQQLAHIPEWDQSIVDWWEKRIDRWHEERQAYNDRVSELYEIEQQHAKDERRRKYDAYLKTPQWKSKRQRVLERDKHLCQACLRRTATQAHHLTYEHIFNEPLFDLIAICEICHKGLHPHME